MTPDWYAIRERAGAAVALTGVGLIIAAVLMSAVGWLGGGMLLAGYLMVRNLGRRG